MGKENLRADKSKRFFGRSRWFDLNRKFNAIPQNDVLCHCEEGKARRGNPSAGCHKWIAALPLVARNDGRRVAFTLAEVLITLTIIGVIAAITIPNLMQNYKRHQVEVGLKTAYSILNNALNIAKTEYNSFEEIVTTSNAKASYEEKANYFMDTYVKPYVKYSKSCDVNACSNSPIFATDLVKTLDGETKITSALQPNSEMSTISLNNGSSVGFLGWNGHFRFMVDINGKKGPNQLCYDTFYFSLQEEAPYLFVGGYLATRYQSYTKNPSLYTTIKYTEGAAQGVQCAAPIMINGWKIPDDYPVKKF